MAREDVEFGSGGVTCRAWLYRPEDGGDATSPCVVMAHGFAGTRGDALPAFAERFAAAGMAALVFDYRHFGASDGEPRQLLSVKRQLADWAAAIAFARTLDGIDPDRVALWGTSFAGGHVIVAGARDGRVAAIVSQVPLADGMRGLANIVSYAGPGYVLKLIGHGIRDAAAAAIGRPAHLIPVVGPPGSVAAMTAPDAEAGYLAIVTDGWRNEYAARLNLTLSSYRPIKSASNLPCPTLFVIAESDSVAPAAAARQMAEQAGGRSEVISHPMGHFEPYGGDWFERVVAEETDFLRRHLIGEATGTTTDSAPQTAPAG